MTTDDPPAAAPAPARRATSAAGAATSPTSAPRRAVYRELAARRSGEEREILLALAEAEQRHEHALARPARRRRRSPAARRSGAPASSRSSRGASAAVFVLALAQQAESRSTYDADVDATAAMAADERIHGEVVRGLATRGRTRISGTFRAAVFGANDGLVSNLALILGVGASGVAPATDPAHRARRSARGGAVDGRRRVRVGALAAGAARGLRPEPGRAGRPRAPRRRRQRARPRLPGARAGRRARPQARAPTRARRAAARPEIAPASDVGRARGDRHGARGRGLELLLLRLGCAHPGAALPLRHGGLAAVAIASCSSGWRCCVTGATVGVLSGASPVRRALRQLAIGFGAAAATYLLGPLFGGHRRLTVRGPPVSAASIEPDQAEIFTRSRPAALLPLARPRRRAASPTSPPA